MSLAHATDGTVPAHPLGIPSDGRKRYSMTASMARAYRWLVLNRPHDGEFLLNFREAAEGIGCNTSAAHFSVVALEERGWLRRVNPSQTNARFAFVHPVKMFREPTGHD